MKRFKKTIYSTCAAIVFTANALAMTYPDVPSSVQGLTAVTIYAGPQSVTPEQIIHVTVEANDLDENSHENNLIELSYVIDGRAKTMTARTSNGLVTFNVPAQETAGLMTFIAKAGAVKSTDAVVIVKAGQPKTLPLNVQSTKVAGTVNVSLGAIIDRFGNPVSDLSLATIEWFDELGVKGSEQVQLFKGKAAYTAPCPVSFRGSLKIRVTFKNVENISSDISSICSDSEG